METTDRTAVEDFEAVDTAGLPTKWHRATFALGVYLTFFALYGLNNRFIPFERCRDLTIGLDHAIPFVTQFMIPFYLTYVIVLLPALLIRDWELFKRGGLSFFVIMVASNIIFWLFPVYVPRPTEIPDTLTGLLVTWMYASDRPVCGFPSLHVSTTITAALLLARDRKIFGWIFGPFAFLTAISTLFVKQHVVADVIGGLVIALIVDRFVVGYRKYGKA